MSDASRGPTRWPSRRTPCVTPEYRSTRYDPQQGDGERAGDEIRHRPPNARRAARRPRSPGSQTPLQAGPGACTDRAGPGGRRNHASAASPISTIAPSPNAAASSCPWRSRGTSGRCAEYDHQQHRELEHRGRPLHEPRDPGLEPLQQAPGRSALRAERNLVDQVGRERAQVEEQLVQRRECAQAARPQAGQIGPVHLVDIDHPVVGLAAERNARGLVKRIAFGQHQPAEQIVVEGDAEILRRRIMPLRRPRFRILRFRGRGTGRLLLRLIEAARRPRPPPRGVRLAGLACTPRRRCSLCATASPGRVSPTGTSTWMYFALHVRRRTAPAVT